MAQPLRVLLLEDQLFDARLTIDELHRAGFDPTWERVDTERDFLARLDGSWDIILADYTLPQFDGLAALQHVQQRGMDIPFILITGSVGEETAVVAMKEGAADYLLKDRLGRLGQAVTQALEQRLQREIQRHAAETIRQNELWFRAIFNQAFVFLTLLNRDGKILEINRPALDFGKVTVDKVRYESFWAAPWFNASADIREEMRLMFAGAVEGRITRRELTIRDANGLPYQVDFLTKPVMNECGSIELLLVEGRDVTDQKLLEEQYRQAQKMEAIGKLAGGIAHDFNNLLTIILGYSDILEDSLPENDPLRELVEEIGKAGIRASKLTRHLLAFSRKQILAPVVLNLSALFLDMEKMLRRVIGEDIELETRLTEDTWPVRVDPGQMEQVFLNLVVNARDAMPKGGHLLIEITNVTLSEKHAASHADAQVGEHIRITVSDNGCGMDPSTLAHIFEPFFSTKGDAGTGLGLATVYGIVKQSGGHIAVVSQPQVGTTFNIYIPRDACGVTTFQSNESKSTTLGTERVLLVEDESGVRSLARTILQRQGYEILEAGSGEEAIAACAQSGHPIQVLVTDVVMPGMSGRELAEKLLRLYPSMKVLYTSGYTDDVIVRHGLENANASFLQKPYTPETLALKVREVLDGAQPRKSPQTHRAKQPDNRTSINAPLPLPFIPDVRTALPEGQH